MRRLPTLKAKWKLGEYRGLPGVSAEALPGYQLRSPKAILKYVRRGIAIGLAGDEGAVAVWMDDAGNFRSSFSRYCVDVDMSQFATKRALGEWLRKWIPATGDKNKLAALR